jgi:hypothetical protein
MREAIASILHEKKSSVQIMEWGWMPHYFPSIRRILSSSLSQPDDVKALHISTYNRKNRYAKHYRRQIVNGETIMIQS